MWKEKRLVRTPDLTGLRFGRLFVEEFSGYSFEKDGKARAMWKCRCDCGNKYVANAKSMKSGNTQSCGCFLNENRKTMHLKHGQSGKNQTLEYQKWCSMKARCYNQNNEHYKNYGGRGITICKRWKYSFENFSEDMGECPIGLTLERKNTNGNYEPSNCVWATTAEQSVNRRNNHFIEYEGRRQTLSQWANEIGIRGNILWKRIKRGWSIEKVLTTPRLRCQA